MKRIGFGKSSLALSALGFSVNSNAPKLVADFVAGTYKASGQTKNFADLFTFNRAGKAWLVKDSGLVEYGIDVPRFDAGLLIEQSATSYSVPYNDIALGDTTTRTANTYKTIKIDDRGLNLQFNPLNAYPAGVPSLPAWNNVVLTKAIKIAGTAANAQVAITTRNEYRESFARLTNVGAVTGLGAKYEHGYLYSVVKYFAAYPNDGTLFYPSQMTVLWGDIAANASTAPKLNATLDILDFQYVKGTHPSTLIGDKSTSSITRPADFLTTTDNNLLYGATLTGDWDSTLQLSIVNGKLSHSGYGTVRTIEISIPKMYADFANNIYVLDGKASTFNNLFAFNRAGKAWLVKESGLVEYAIDTPRFDNGLLIEQAATNYAAWSFLPENGSYFKRGLVFTNGHWVYDGIEVSTAYLYTLPHADLSQGNRILSTQAVGVSFALMRTGTQSLTSLSHNGEVDYFVKIPPDTSSINGLVYSKVANQYALYYQVEGLNAQQLPTSPIKTTTAAVTRPADFLTSKITTGSTLTGDWDSTLNLTLVNGQIVRSGYGRIRTLEIN